MGAVTKQVKQLDRVIIRFAGDSGDGMQLTGDRFTQESAAFGNDLSTLPNFPAEIRAPQGTLPGVSSFQVHFADHDILTPGDAPDVLVAMNPAALKANLADMKPGTAIIVDSHDFSARNLTKAGYVESPLENDTLADYALTRAKLAQMALTIDSAALLIYRAAWLRDSGANVTREAAMAKLAATEGAQQVIDAAVQMWGGRGVQSGETVERLYREIRALRIYEGASEVQQLIIGRDLLKAHGQDKDKR